jgi:8-oxo-dGTP pyrophosphatase MutT (NUDIX family)
MTMTAPRSRAVRSPRSYEKRRSSPRAEPRAAVRAVVLAERREVLLMRMDFAWREGGIWVTPGGGIEPDESPLAALQRELAEETGRADLTIGPYLFERIIDLPAGAEAPRQHERYYLVECSRFEP